MLCNLLFHDLQQFHGAGLDADAAGDALGCGTFGLHDHDLHGAGLHALAAANTELLVDHVYAGLGILGNSAMFAGTHALTALDAGHGLGTGALSDHLDAGKILMEFLIECGGAGTDALQTCHALDILFNSKLLHVSETPSLKYSPAIIHDTRQNSKAIFKFSKKTNISPRQAVFNCVSSAHSEILGLKPTVRAGRGGTDSTNRQEETL